MEIRKISHVLFHEKSEELTFPKIFFKGKFGYTFPSEYYLTPTKYFNQRLLNYSKKFDKYIFFVQSVLQQKKVSDQINMVMKKVLGRLIADIIANYEETVTHFVSNDQGFSFMNQTKATPAYSK